MAQKDGVKKRIADRKAFVGATKGAGTAVAARKKFFVQTRMAELKAKGKTGDAKALRAKFDSGGVTRAGFYNKVDKARNKAGRGGSNGAGGGGSPARVPKSNVTRDAGPTVRPKSNVTRDAGPAGKPYRRSNRGGGK